jgi:hypothetical protein
MVVVARVRVSPGLVAIGCSTALALALVAPLARADLPISDEARSRFAAGVNLLKDPDGPRYEEAYREFKAAYAASPSYKILGNLALSAMKLERDEEAISAYDKYLADDKDLDPTEVQQVKTDLSTLKASVMHVTVESDPPGARLVDVRLPVRGERVTNAYGPIDQSTRLGLHPGSHQMTAKREGYPDLTWEFEAAAGQEMPPHKFVFASPTVAPLPVASSVPTTVEPSSVATRRPATTGFWIGATATGALTVATVVTGVISLGKHSTYDSTNTGQESAAQQAELPGMKSSGQTLNIVTDACLGGAIVAAIVTTVLFFTRPTVEVAAEPRVGENKESTHVELTPTWGSSGGGLSLQGSF